jgi:Polyketide cyclase / dehydrase and lipid transport.
MTRLTATVEIGAPVEQVWAFASDWRHWDEWWEGASGFRPTTEAARGDGARYAYRTRIAGWAVDVETEIHGFVEKSGWYGVATQGPPHRTQWLFEARGPVTRFTYRLEYGLPVPLIGPLADALLVRPAWQRWLEASLRNLKRHFEGQPASGGAGARVAVVTAPPDAGEARGH